MGYKSVKAIENGNTDLYREKLVIWEGGTKKGKRVNPVFSTFSCLGKQILISTPNPNSISSATQIVFPLQLNSYFLSNSNRVSSPTQIIFPISKSHVCGRETLSDSWLASLASFGNPPIKLEFKIGHK